jgi:hypothetical protein
MKALIIHANSFGFDVISPSDRLGGAAPEEVSCSSTSVEDCLVVLFHVEENDGDYQINRCCKDIGRFAKGLGAERLVVAAFGHLSHSYAPAATAMEIARRIVATCQSWGDYEVHTSPFGHNKTFDLRAKGHPKAFKHRSY